MPEEAIESIQRRHMISSLDREGDEPTARQLEPPAPVLVLDLDGTLLDTTPAGTRRGTPPTFRWKNKETRLRPGLASFLSAVVAHGYELAVWTSAPAEYADAMVAGIRASGAPLPLLVTFSAEETEFSWSRGPQAIKDVRKLAARLDRPTWRMLVLDDTPETYSRNAANALPVPTYAGGAADGVLAELQELLVSMELGAPLDTRRWRLAPKGAALLTEPAPGRRLGGLQEDVLLEEEGDVSLC